MREEVSQEDLIKLLNSSVSQMADFSRKSIFRGLGSDPKIAGPYDAVNKFGKTVSGSKLPGGIEKQKYGECFMNAINLALYSSKPYVEGYAIRSGIFVPIHHAWVQDGEVVIDNTWDDAESCAYFGIKFDPSAVFQVFANSGYYRSILDGYWRHKINFSKNLICFGNCSGFE